MDSLSLHVRPGEIDGFLDHNGAGKTTTIKACCGILDFTEGEILINGMSIKKQPLECRKILAYIPDNPDLYEFMSSIQYLLNSPHGAEAMGPARTLTDGLTGSAAA